MKIVLRIVMVFSAIILSGCTSMLYYPSQQPFVAPEQLEPHKPEDVYFSSEDGTRLHGWYFRSSSRSSKGAILFFHGNAQNLTTHFYALYWLLPHGYDYFIFDYRGYGKSEGKPTPEGTVRDGRAALRWLSERVKGQMPIAIFGQSLGGAVAMRVAADMRDEVPYQGVIVDSTFHSFQKVGQTVLSRSYLTWPFQLLAHVLLDDEHAPEDRIASISPRPLLVVHGTNDSVVDLSLGEKVFSLAGEPKEFWKIEGGGHTDFLFRASENGNYENRVKFIKWLDRHLEKPGA